ncbi:hypothetical protein [Mycolicibacterium chubuense]|nr:hypothetical protein [Mycolicibacterium chubuense]
MNLHKTIVDSLLGGMSVECEEGDDPMTWWNEAGAHWGWGGCLLAIVMLLAFWGAVIAALAALLGANRPQRREDIETQRDARVPGLTIDDCVATTKPPHCR